MALKIEHWCQCVGGVKQLCLLKSVQNLMEINNTFKSCFLTGFWNGFLRLQKQINAPNFLAANKTPPKKSRIILII